MPWVLGGCGCLFVLLLIAALIGYSMWRAAKAAQSIRNEVRSTMEQNLSPTPGTSGARSPAPAESPTDDDSTGTTPSGIGSGTRSTTQRAPAPSGWSTYVNVKAKLPTALQEHFVAFSFSYPPSFVLQQQDESNFVKVEKYGRAGKGTTAQNFAVGYASFPPLGAELFYDTLLTQFSTQFKPSFPGYHETKRMPVTVGDAVGKGMCFEGEFPNKVKIYGKTLIVHPRSSGAGAAILMLATSFDPTIHSADDLGTKGETAQILQTFRFE